MESNNRGQLSPVHLLHRAAQAAENIFSSEMKLSGLTPRQLVVLMTVARNEGLSQTAIMNKTGIDRTTTAAVVVRLRRKSLLHRRRSPSDQRAYIIQLTDQGRQVLLTAEPLAKRIDERVLDALPAKRRDQFIGALQTIVTILQSASQDGSPIMS